MPKRARSGAVGVQVQLDAAGRRPLVDHDVDAVVLHGRIEVFLHHGAEPVDLVDEEHVVRLQRGQYARQIAGLVQHGAGRDLEAHAQLVGDDVAQGGLPQPRRAVQQRVVERLAPVLGRLHEHFQVLHHLLLPAEVPELQGAQGVLELPFGGRGLRAVYVKIFFHRGKDTAKRGQDKKNPPVFHAGACFSTPGKEVTLSKRQNRPRENRANGRGDGDGRKHAILAGLRERRMKAGGRFALHFADCQGTPCGRVPPPRRPARGKGWQKDKWILHAESPQPEGKSRPKPRFPPLSTRPETSLRQEIFVFAARKKFLSAKKSRFCRTKTPAEAEKCSIRTAPAPVF